MNLKIISDELESKKRNRFIFDLVEFINKQSNQYKIFAPVCNDIINKIKELNVKHYIPTSLNDKEIN